MGPRRVSLCNPCGASWVVGRTAATAAVLRGASIEVRAATGSIRGRVVLGSGVPTLQVGLGDGATLRLPASIPAVVTGFTGRIVLLAGGRVYDLGAASRTARTITLPDDKVLTGRHDLTFVLARPGGARLTAREAQATVYDALLVGRR